ncbi:MAG: HD domain-containing protein [Ruminococcaceae bacterium]|nr:HD domain-containing protein [Oscillospiraceae bacterium]
MNITRDDILNLLVLSPKRFKHTLGTEKAALELARLHHPDLDVEKVAFSALLHDMTKEYSVEQHIAAAEKFGVSFSDVDILSPKLLHSKTASLISRFELKLPDDVCDAILYHTTGRIAMTPLEEVLYFADYIEENRVDDECVSLRESYKSFLNQFDPRVALDKSLVLSFDRTIGNLMKKSHIIDKNTVEARNYYLKKTFIK